MTPHFEALAQQFVAGRRYNNVSEVIRDGLRLLEARTLEKSAKLVALKGAVRVGLDDIESGHVSALKTPQNIEIFVSQSVSQSGWLLRAVKGLLEHATQGQRAMQSAGHISCDRM